MKKALLIFVAGMMLTACEKAVDDIVEQPELKTKTLVFNVKGDFQSPTFKAPRRAPGLTADGTEMTDLWLFDYVGGQLVQQLHQTPADADWGTPSLTLAYGSHHIYFVAARGDGPTVDTSTRIITWTKPKDTFWKDYQVDVTETTKKDRSLTLSRVATKLAVHIADKVPAELKKVTITPASWYYGFDYATGTAEVEQQTERSVDVPASYVGTTGELLVSIFGLSDAEEWTTDVAVKALDTDGSVLGQVTISGAPFKRNRVTDYTGNLLGSGGKMTLDLDDTWQAAFTAEW